MHILKFIYFELIRILLVHRFYLSKLLIIHSRTFNLFITQPNCLQCTNFNELAVVDDKESMGISDAKNPIVNDFTNPIVNDQVRDVYYSFGESFDLSPKITLACKNLHVKLM